MPFGQLDGGHIVYAVLGRRAGYVSIATLVAAMLPDAASRMSWISMTVMMLVMAIFLGFRHPRIVDEDTPLDGTRRLVALVALVIFVLCFTPVPIQTFLGGITSGDSGIVRVVGLAIDDWGSSEPCDHGGGRRAGLNAAAVTPIILRPICTITVAPHITLTGSTSTMVRRLRSGRSSSAA